MISIPISTRHVFFTGKGGVGKTALACAVAIALADHGQRVLLISTDPASNLDEMLGARVSTEPSSVPGVRGLFALNVDPVAAAEAYRERVLAPYRGVKSEDELRTLREQLAGACTVEIAAFDRFATLLAEPSGGGEFDRAIFDTAPTGHTLRLLQLPRAWTEFLETSRYSASCLGPHKALETEHERFAAAMRTLGDREETTIVLVARPDGPSLREAERTARELDTLDICHHQLVVNAVFRATDAHDPVAVALERRGRDALEAMPPALRALPTTFVPLRGFNMVGIPALRALLADDVPERPAASGRRVELPSGLARLSDLIDELETSAHGLVMVTGKGGVGKTTIAAALAVELASRGIPTHLSTTDPAAHVAATVADSVEHLEISRIDPVTETRAYTARVLNRKGRGLDAAGRALLEEDLRSPCTEEVAVFIAFSRVVMQASAQFVVLDTAPTGHTLLLLDTAGAYHRELTRNAVDSPLGRVVTPLMRMQDPDYTKVLIVTLAETTPVTEAARLQADLRRAGIEPFAWVINSSLATTATRDPLLRQRIAREIEQIERVQHDLARRVVIVPWVPVELIGPERLRALVRGEIPQCMGPGGDAEGTSPQGHA